MNSARSHPPSLLELLREETRPRHRLLEGNPRMVRLLTPALTLQDYGEILLRYHALLSVFECQLSRYQPEWHQLDYDAMGRVKTPRIERDLSALGLTPGDPDAITGGMHLKTDPFTAMMGTLYVIEGSSMGGQVISRHLRRHLQLVPENGAAYFNSDGAETPRSWEAFQTVLRAFENRSPDTGQVVESACHAFAAFDQVLR